MNKIRTKQTSMKRERRRGRIRARVSGSAERPRLSVFRSNRYLSVQIIDDTAGKTIATASTKSLKGKTPLEKASALGKSIAELARKQSISKVVFDRGGYLYTGRIKAVADGAREGGLVF